MSTRLYEALGFTPTASNYLYALCDYQTLLNKKLSLQDFIEKVKKYDVKIIQYRDKVNSNNIQIENLKILKENFNIPIIINDKIELLEYADGLHLGQEDLQQMKDEKLKFKDETFVFKFLRKKYPKKLFGLSTHNEKEILQANRYEIDMIGLGAYKATSTKDVSTHLGEKISYLAKISKHPVCGIGGVNIEDKIENITFNVVGSGLYK